jgi:lipoic acid synthetase
MSTETLAPKKHTPKPKWLRVKLPTGKKYTELRGLVDKYDLHTICTSGSCPNMGECWGEGTATFMILGNICTRSCGFCGVKTGRPETVDWDEPEKVARSIKIMKIKHAVITSVDRDDIKDMGSIIWAETVKAIRRMNPETTLETLIPDFQGNTRNIDRIIAVKPEVVSHNMETVKRLTREVRIQAKYERSLEVLDYFKKIWNEQDQKRNYARSGRTGRRSFTNHDGSEKCGARYSDHWPIPTTFKKTSPRKGIHHSRTV